MRVVGLDLGSKRVGVAVSDSEGLVATPHGLIVRTGDGATDRAAVAALITEVAAEAVVVGLPTSLDGSRGPAAIQAEEEASELQKVVDVPVYLHDERFTTVTADRALRAMNVKRRRRKESVDQAAATIMLQSWLDSRP